LAPLQSQTSSSSVISLNQACEFPEDSITEDDN
jgi:hypothetical protein